MSIETNDQKGAGIVPPPIGEQASLALISLVSSGMTVAQARAKLAGNAPTVATAVQAPVVSEPVADVVQSADEGDELVIPKDWRKEHHFKIIAMAKAANPEMAELIVTKEDAIEVLEQLEAQS